MMGQQRKNPTATSGPRMTEAEITKAVKDYSSTSYQPKKQKADMSPKAIRRREDEEYQ
jgi:hypothetical protein